MLIDLRSDTVTQPSAEMRTAMAQADVGDDVYGDDPTVNALQAEAVRLSGKEAALFLPTGTQANLVALLSHCQRGEEYIVGQQAHNYKYEAGGAAVLGSIQPQPIEANPDGTLPLDKVAAAIKPDDIHFAKTRLLSLENTISGRVLPLEYLQQAWQFTREHKLALHIDGARIFNAAVALNVPLKTLAQYCDTFTICLSKGLGAPVGSLLCGSEEFIQRANRWRKMTGGGMRQAGILAAAGLYALEHNVERLKEDHDNAKWLEQQLRDIGVDIAEPGAQTNVLYLRQSPELAAKLGPWMRERGVLISAGPLTRILTHLNVSRQDLQKVVDLWREFLQQHA
ncbi:MULTISPECIES: low-specificity L-threonine aldolase [Serratia]|jgi:threonine aldolase|uniref:Low specificity L-threonine aldolase n=1 Tax=Serratia fonticola TaxID=47917 RepID=A0A0F7D2I5_SERFO|nr:MULTISPECIES: low-specificity L-threonine aldolase [Serratia]AKG70795.1 threonine aldolase [Serratia fonticola]AYM89745.1 low-specificity L-threonine aldolase [Serratia sp. 3ACOL1]MBL5824590.1 low-specificity L-threonine aldolase [Serratia fonticola]MBL5862963.1 low-specificity L-threonine aldolase [Serratia fonticola]MBL5902172.1 low-specificity L-threonine aldolase [Serratia fonticola]